MEDNDIIIINKCDVIQPTNSNQEKNWEVKLAGKQNAEESPNGLQKLKNQKKGTEEGPHQLFC